MWFANSQKGFSSVLIVVIVFGALFLAVFLYRSNSTKTQTPNLVQQSIDNTKQDVPAGNPNWDKAQELFTQLRSEEDLEQIKQIDAQVVTELKEVLKQQPNNPRVWVELGHAYTWMTNLDPKLAEEGLSAYKKATELDPTNPIYLDYVADQLIMMKRYDEAVLELQKSARLYPKGSGFTNLRLARAYTGLQIYDQATEHYQEAIELFTKQNKDGKFDDEILQARTEMNELPQK